MGVVESAGKERLICNDRYVNAFLKPIPFEYEKLRDVLAFTQQNSFMATADLKSGYFHVPIHPAYWKYFAFRVGGTVFFHKVLCFGFAQACFVFTKVMQEPILEIRSRGIPMSGYIDDSFTGAKSFGIALRQILFIILLMGALGAYFGIPKCQLEPLQIVKWLGFTVDSREAKFKLGTGRMAKLKEALVELKRAPSTSPRKLARMAGLLAAAAPAVLPVALYSRSFYEALSGRASWDYLFPTPSAVAEAAEFWLANLDEWNGRRWWPRGTTVRLEIDASGVGYGGRVVLQNGRELRLSGTFTGTEAASSSTEREVIGYAAGIELVSAVAPEQIRGRSVLITGDSQAGLTALGRFRSTIPLIRSKLQNVLETSARFDFDVVTRWVPREEITEAYARSREPDASDWGICAEILQKAASKFEVRVAIDLFASGRFHVTRRFVSKFYTPGCESVHALALEWESLVGKDECAWVFPPAGIVSAVIERLATSRIRALLCIATPK